MLEGTYFGCPIPISLLSDRNRSLAGITEPLPFALARGKGQGMQNIRKRHLRFRHDPIIKLHGYSLPKSKKAVFYRADRRRVGNRQMTKQVPFLNNIALIIDAGLLHLQ